MDVQPLDIRFEPTVPDDFEALLALRIAAMQESLERIGRFDPERARQRLAATFDPSSTRHIVVAGERVGFVMVRPADDSLTLEHLYVVPGHQGRGIGAQVLSEVFREADLAGRALRVGALRGSDSNRFYVRHGFVLTDEEEFDLYYLRQPGSVA